MPRPCSVCTHKKAKKINIDILNGQTVTKISVKYSLSRAAVTRHKKTCIAAAVKLAQDNTSPKRKKKRPKDPGTIANQKAVAIREKSAGEKIIEKLEGLEVDARDIQLKATQSKNYSAALAAIKEQSRIFEIYINLATEMNKMNKTEIDEINDAWADVKEVLLELFAEYPKIGDRFGELVSTRLARHW